MRGRLTGGPESPGFPGFPEAPGIPGDPGGPCKETETPVRSQQETSGLLSIYPNKVTVPPGQMDKQMKTKLMTKTVSHAARTFHTEHFPI